MPVWTAIKLDMKTNVFMEVLGTPATAGDDVFDSKLKPSTSAAVNHMLTLNLRIFLQKFQPPHHLRSATFKDFDKTSFVVGPWNHAEWQNFVFGFKKQCLMWNNNFWLIPPNDFSALDIKMGTKKVRPNVYCNLDVQIMPTAARAHRTIQVVNLDAKSAARAAGKRESDVTSGDFRSDSSTYDTFDVRPRTDTYTDNTGHVQKVRHYTIAHEIGHALGQAHIGVLRHEKLCDMAVLVDDAFTKAGLSSAVPAMFSGGSNSDVCYGDFSAAAVSSNVMGGGGTFEPLNAQPWLEQIPRHTLTRNKWTVSMRHIAPKAL
jgi:hypothetical protein